MVCIVVGNVWQLWSGTVTVLSSSILVNASTAEKHMDIEFYSGRDTVAQEKAPLQCKPAIDMTNEPIPRPQGLWGDDQAARQNAMGFKWFEALLQPVSCCFSRNTNKTASGWANQNGVFINAWQVWFINFPGTNQWTKILRSYNEPNMINWKFNFLGSTVHWYI